MKKKIIIICIIVLALVALISVIVIKNSINNKDDEAKITVKDGLSINYLNGDDLYSKTKDKIYKISITNDSSKEMYYQINVDNFRTSPSVSYTFKNDDEEGSEVSSTFEENILLEYKLIKPGETHTFTLNVNKSIKEIYIGKLNVIEYSFEQEYFSQIILKNNNVLQGPKTTVGTEISQEDEGLIQDIDDYGITYYFRGNVKNNYFRFADRLWRIVRINGNGTVKIVLDGTTEDVVEYYTDGAQKYSYESSNLKTYLSSWYNDNIKQYDKYIASNKICDDFSFTGTDEYIFNSSQRLSVNHNPTFNCLGNKLGGKISVLTADEIEYAGGLIGVVNLNYYLYNSSIANNSWTLTPAKGNADSFYPYTLATSGSIDDNVMGNQQKAVRPVLNIVKDVSVDGTGSIDDPYEILY